jgi:hypothetical protein
MNGKSLSGIWMIPQVVLFLLPVLALGQVEWSSEDYRRQLYPDKDFISSYVMRSGIKSGDAESAMKLLVNTARGNLIEKIRVEVQSQSTSQLSDINGQVSDSYKNVTTTESNLDIVGLEVLRNYDKKRKVAECFVYTSKLKLARYYGSLIDQDLDKIRAFINESETYLKSQNLKEAYNVLSRSYKLLFEIEDARAVLLALGADNEGFYNRIRVPEVSNDFNAKMESLKKNPLMTVDDLGFILSNSIKQSFPSDGSTKKIEDITFQETGLASEFSFQLKESIQQNFQGIQEENYAFVMKGNYWDEGNLLKVSCKIVKKNGGALQGTGMAWIHKSGLKDKNTVFIPKDIGRMEEIPGMTIVAMEKNIKGTAGRGLVKELRALVNINGVAKQGVAVKFYNNGFGDVYCRSLSDVNGIARCKVSKINGKYKNQVIKAELDLEKYVSINPDHPYFQNIMKNTEIPSASIPVIIEPTNVTIKSEELNFGKKLDVLLIEPQVKSLLSEKGYRYTEDEDQAELVIWINAASRKGGNMSGLYFSFVDVSVSVYDNIEGKEIFKKSFKNFKGGGGSFDDAGAKAFYTAAEKVGAEIAEVL